MPPEQSYDEWRAANPDPTDDEVDEWYTPSGRLRSPETVMRNRDRRQSAAARAAHEASLSSSGRRTSTRNPSRSGSARRTTRHPSPRGPARRVARRRSSTFGRSYGRAARQLQAPAEQQLASGMRVIGMTLAVTALYLVLTNAAPFAGVLGGFGRGLAWLSDPTRSIPYAPGTGS
jgi:hypothetical protein